jgi:hypothetical protein
MVDNTGRDGREVLVNPEIALPCAEIVEVDETSFVLRSLSGQQWGLSLDKLGEREELTVTELESFPGDQT